jgi:arylsulfatase A-like enzyme
MQWLADTGACMQHAFCPSAVCSPARASFFTGRIPSHHGIHDWIQEPNERMELPHIEGQKTIAQYLKEAGYQTGLVGKWHCGRCWRKQAGWDTWFTSALGTNARFGEQAYFENEERQEFFGHQEPIITDRAVRFLQESKGNKDKPFFLFVGYTNTHTPHSGEVESVVEKYRQCSFEDIPEEIYGSEHGHARIEPFQREDPSRREQLAQYYAAVDVIDRQMARLFTELESMGELDNTLIVYTGDHGHMNGHHGLHTKTNATIPTNFLEESIHVPLLIRWPERINAGQSPKFPVDHCDLFATLLDAAGVDAKAATSEVTSPGKSYLSLLQGQQINWRDYQICEHSYSRMIRTDQVKLIRREPSKVAHYPDELYDLEKDPREMHNVITDSAYQGIITQLDQILESHFRKYSDPEKAGTNMETILHHNERDPWNTLPGTDDHRQ